MLMLFKTDLLLLEGWLPGPRTCREAGSLHSWLHGLCRSACQAFNVSHRSTKDSLSSCHLLDMPLGTEMNSMYKGAGGSLSSRVFGHRSTSSAVWLWKDRMRRGESEGEGAARGRWRCWCFGNLAGLWPMISFHASLVLRCLLAWILLKNFYPVSSMVNHLVEWMSVMQGIGTAYKQPRK